MFAKKSLGQNFLQNVAVAATVADAIEVTRSDTVLEIGPGTGMLTRVLLEKGARVIAVEKDRSLLSLLTKKFEDAINVEQLVLLEGDILTDEVQAKIFTHLHTKYKVAANIPYYITGKFFRFILPANPQPCAVSLLVQKEVAERLVTKNKKESILSISIKAYGTPKYVKTVGRKNFAPSPKVDSAVIAIENISKDLFSGFPEDEFFSLVRAGFLHKRKRVRKNIENAFPEKEISLSHIPENARAEDLTLEDWRRMLQ